MWPILCKVFCEDMRNVYKPFAVCIFYGNGKPKSVFEFLESFICDINNLSRSGVIIQAQHF